MSKMVKTPPDIRALLVRELATALVLDWQRDTDAMVHSVGGKDHKTRPQTGKISS
jgi:hypothetical protein